MRSRVRDESTLDPPLSCPPAPDTGIYLPNERLQKLPTVRPIEGIISEMAPGQVDQHDSLFKCNVTGYRLVRVYTYTFFIAKNAKA